MKPEDSSPLENLEDRYKELAGMSDQEKERFLNRLHQKKKDGSWLERLSPAPLA